MAPRSVLLLLAVVPAMLAGCLSVPESPAARDMTAVPTRSSYSQAHGLAGTTEAAVLDNWVVQFDDKEMAALVAEAIRNNPDLAQAAAVYEESEALVKSAQAALFPQLDGLAGASRTNEGINPKGKLPPAVVNQYNLGLSISWEIDVWGRLRSTTKAAQQDAAAAASDLGWARESLAAQVADSWFLAITAHRQEAISAELLKVQQTTLRITQAKATVGRLTMMDLNLAKANVASAEVAVQQNALAYQNAVRSLELLLGRYPATELQARENLPAMPAAFPVGVPSQVLERRPDVMAADHVVAAAFHRVQSAKAAQLPAVVLSGSVSEFLNPTSDVWSIGGNLLAPLFDGGTRQAAVDLSQAQQRGALAGYVKAGLRAFNEVETALANLRVLGENEVQLQAATDELKQAASVAQKRYDAGQLSLLDLNQVQIQYFATWSTLVNVHSERLQQAVNLYLATGSSFETPMSYDPKVE